jgi:hypothetical protein
MKAVCDNDVLLKGVCYGFLEALISTVPESKPVGVLASSRFIVRKKISKMRLNRPGAQSLGDFDAFIAVSEIIEPSKEEQVIAARFESAAQVMALNLDAGESQLLAVAISRCVEWLLTGDKRAIVSVELLLRELPELNYFAGRIRCLEQLVRSLILATSAATVRAAICAEPLVDTALRICFACSSSKADHADILEGLDSYIEDLRKRAQTVLSI